MLRSILGMSWSQGPLQDPSATASISAPDESPWTRQDKTRDRRQETGLIKTVPVGTTRLKTMSPGNMERHSWPWLGNRIRWSVFWAESAAAGGLDQQTTMLNFFFFYCWRVLKSVLFLHYTVETWFTLLSAWGLFITLFGVKGFYICYT